MTLNEYLHPSRPTERLPSFSVNIERNECTLYRHGTEYACYIPAIHFTYRVGQYGGLWTMDAHGNRKSASVFTINFSV